MGWHKRLKFLPCNRVSINETFELVGALGGQRNASILEGDKLFVICTSDLHRLSPGPAPATNHHRRRYLLWTCKIYKGIFHFRSGIRALGNTSMYDGHQFSNYLRYLIFLRECKSVSQAFKNDVNRQQSKFLTTECLLSLVR